MVDNAANLTLTGGAGQILNSTTSANALAGFAVNSASGSFALAANQNFTTGENFTNNGALTINRRSTFAVKSGSSLTNFNGSTKTLTGGTFTVGGTLEWSGANVVNNAANLTLTGGSGQLLRIRPTMPAHSPALSASTAPPVALRSLRIRISRPEGISPNNGTLVVNSSSTFAVKSGSSLNNFNGSTKTLTGGTFTVGGTLEWSRRQRVSGQRAANLTHLTGGAGPNSQFDR